MMLTVTLLDMTQRNSLSVGPCMNLWEGRWAMVMVVEAGGGGGGGGASLMGQ